MHPLQRVFSGGNVQSAKRYRRNFVARGTSAQAEGARNQNSEKPPLDRTAGRAMGCIGQAAIVRSDRKEMSMIKAGFRKRPSQSMIGMTLAGLFIRFGPPKDVCVVICIFAPRVQDYFNAVIDRARGSLVVCVAG
jgi:hypothetical protein